MIVIPEEFGGGRVVVAGTPGAASGFFSTFLPSSSAINDM
jgi:hypothetical protein